MRYLVLRWTRDSWGVYTPDGCLVKRLTRLAEALDVIAAWQAGEAADERTA
jgi:hypothetical protein